MNSGSHSQNKPIHLSSFNGISSKWDKKGVYNTTLCTEQVVEVMMPWGRHAIGEGVTYRVMACHVKGTHTVHGDPRITHGVI